MNIIKNREGNKKGKGGGGGGGAGNIPFSALYHLKEGLEKHSSYGKKIKYKKCIQSSQSKIGNAFLKYPNIPLVKKKDL